MKDDGTNSETNKSCRLTGFVVTYLRQLFLLYKSYYSYRQFVVGVN